LNAIPAARALTARPCSTTTSFVISVASEFPLGRRGAGLFGGLVVGGRADLLFFFLLGMTVP
jgi:hypothetical protein